jgi:hypothetical protein
MQSVSYTDAEYAVRGDFADSHSRFWQRLAAPGTWFTSAERIAIAREVRAGATCTLCIARKAALSPTAAVAGTHSHTTELRPAIVDAVHRITTDAARMTQAAYQQLLEAGISDGEYIEIVGTVVAMVSIDSFAVALGLPLRELPAPGAGTPSRYRPGLAANSADAWVPMLPPENAGTPEADLWVSGRTGNVIRAMSLVPDEVRTLGDLSAAHYLVHKLVAQPGADAGRALGRSQMELVAGRVSALNQCYY